MILMFSLFDIVLVYALFEEYKFVIRVEISIDLEAEKLIFSEVLITLAISKGVMITSYVFAGAISKRYEI